MLKLIVKNLFLYTILGCIFLTAFSYLHNSFTKDYIAYKLESKCVSKIIKRGHFHRNEIWTKDGKCGIKPVFVGEL